MGGSDDFDEEYQASTLLVPVLVPLAIIVMILVYAFYIVDSINQNQVENEFNKNVVEHQGDKQKAKRENEKLFYYVEKMSFGVFLLSQMGQIFLCLYSKRQLDGFLKQYPVIENQKMLERLKPLIRINMYFVPIGIFFIGLAILTGLICLAPNGRIQASIVIVLWGISTVIAIGCSNTEKKIRGLDCTNATLEEELESLSHSWLKRLFPDF